MLVARFADRESPRLLAHELVEAGNELEMPVNNTATSQLDPRTDTDASHCQPTPSIAGSGASTSVVFSITQAVGAEVADTHVRVVAVAPTPR